MTYSIDFRRKALTIKEQGNLSFDELAKRFGVGKASLVRWSARPGPCRTRKKPAAKISGEALKRDVELYPDAYQYERAARLGASQQGVCSALKRLGIRHKKTLSNPKADEEARARRECLGQRRLPQAGAGQGRPQAEKLLHRGAFRGRIFVITLCWFSYKEK